MVLNLPLRATTNLLRFAESNGKTPSQIVAEMAEDDVSLFEGLNERVFALQMMVITLTTNNRQGLTLPAEQLGDKILEMTTQEIMDACGMNDRDKKFLESMRVGGESLMDSPYIVTGALIGKTIEFVNLIAAADGNDICGLSVGLTDGVQVDLLGVRRRFEKALGFKNALQEGASAFMWYVSRSSGE